MRNLRSTELHINNPNPPVWDPRKHYWEQSKDVLQYYEEERHKIVNGVNIGGYFFHPLLYWHINYFKTPIPTPIKGRPGHVHNKIRNPVLDDNTMYIIDNYRDAEEQSKGMILFGSRGFLKTTFLSSLMHWLSVTKQDSTCSVVGGNSGDLSMLASNIQTSLESINPAFYIPRISTDWDSEVVFGIKEKNNRPIVHSKLAIFNADPDKKSKSEVGAGQNPSGFIIDEALWEEEFLPTPDGKIKMKDVKVGDYVISGKGVPTKVLSKINPGIQETYAFVFSDGKEIISSLNHKWLVYRKNILTEGGEVLTTSQIISEEDHNNLLIPSLKNGLVEINDIEYRGKKQVYCIGVECETKTFVVDGGIVTHNCGKFDFSKVWESALPSFKTPHGYRLVPILSGCVCADTMVWNNKGELIKIQDLKQEEGIIGFNGSSYLKEDINWFKKPQHKDCFRVTLEGGNVLECSHDHPLLKKLSSTEVTPCKVENLKVGDRVAYVEEVGIFGNVSQPHARLMGLFIGDGNSTKNGNNSISVNEEEIEEFILNNYETTIWRNKVTKTNKSGCKQISVRGMTEVFREAGIQGKVKGEKSFPKDVYQYDKKSLSEFIAGYFDADGNIRKVSNHFGLVLTSKYKHLLVEMKHLLTKFGIVSSIYKENRGKGGFKCVDPHIYRLYVVKRDSVIKFRESIPLLINKKREVIEKVKTGRSKKKYKFVYDEEIEKGKYFQDKEVSNCVLLAVRKVESIGSQMVYNLNTSISNSYISNGILSFNTGGSNTLSTYAKQVLSSPESYGLIPINWELLERGVPKEAITWERSKKGKFGTFVPGQMSYRLEGGKLDSNLSDFLGINDTKLKKIDLKVTDWNQKTELIKTMTTDKNLGEDGRNKNKMYYPLETADCFLTKSINPFPTKIIDRHIRNLEDMGKLGKNVDIVMDGSKPTISFSEKKRADIHHKGGNVDAPIVLHGILPETPPDKYLNVSGFDGYKLEDSDTDSLGSLYVLRRRHMEANSPCETILCSYTSRPNRMKEFNAQCERIIEVFNAQCCMESVDMGLMQYLDQKGKADDLLAPAFTFSNSANANSNLRSRFGLYPTKANNEFRFNLLVEFTKEEHTIGIDDQGNEIIKYGVEFIDDIDLLKEMMNYYKGGNFDRIIAFSHALVYARELDKENTQPKPKKKLMTTSNIKPRQTKVNPYGNIRHKRY